MRKWDERHFKLAQEIASWSKDPEHQVGCVIVDTERRPVSWGYNGFPRLVHDDADRYADRIVKRKLIVHAEANAVLQADRRMLRGSTTYTTRHPCTECSKLLIQVGIARVVAPMLAPDSTWAEDAGYARTMLTEAGVLLEVF